MHPSSPRLCPICHAPAASPDETYCERHRDQFVHWTCEGCGAPVTQHVSIVTDTRLCRLCQARDRAAHLTQAHREALILARHARGRLAAIQDARRLLNLSLADATLLVMALE